MYANAHMVHETKSITRMKRNSLNNLISRLTSSMDTIILLFHSATIIFEWTQFSLHRAEKCRKLLLFHSLELRSAWTQMEILMVCEMKWKQNMKRKKNASGIKYIINPNYYLYSCASVNDNKRRYFQREKCSLVVGSVYLKLWCGGEGESEHSVHWTRNIIFVFYWN